MQRSIGVTVIAVLSLLGSLFAFFMGVLMAALPFLSSEFGTKDSPFSPAFFKLIMVFASLMYLLPAIWGIVTSIGLFRLKEWARISTIVFSVLLILVSGFSALMFLVVPMPPPPNQPVAANIASGVRIVMISFAAALAGIGIWWLVFFTRARVKQQFQPVRPVVARATLEVPQPLPDSFVPTTATAVPARPLSITIIAWLLLVGCVFLPISILLRYPAAIFTKVVTGWPASTYYLVAAAVQLYVGIGLLRLKRLARSVGVAYYSFFFVNMAVFYLAPGGRSRMLDLMQRSLPSFPWSATLRWQNQINPEFTSMLSKGFVMGACLGLVGILVPLYFLVTRKEAFERAAAVAADHSLSTSPNQL